MERQASKNVLVMAKSTPSAISAVVPIRLVWLRALIAAN
jgi:hypothetical protein